MTSNSNRYYEQNTIAILAPIRITWQTQTQSFYKPWQRLMRFNQSISPKATVSVYDMRKSFLQCQGQIMIIVYSGVESKLKVIVKKTVIVIENLWWYCESMANKLFRSVSLQKLSELWRVTDFCISILNLNLRKEAYIVPDVCGMCVCGVCESSRVSTDI